MSGNTITLRGRYDGPLAPAMEAAIQRALDNLVALNIDRTVVQYEGESTETKRCARCRQHQPAEAYTPSAFARGAYCKRCTADYMAAHYRKQEAAKKRTCCRCGIGFQRWAEYNRPSGSQLSNCRTCYNALCAERHRRRTGIDTPYKRREQKSLVAGKAPQGPLWQALRNQVMAEESHCGICGELVDKQLPPRDRLSATIDHIHPVAFGGGHERANLRLAHKTCNSRLGQRQLWDKVKELQARVDALSARVAELEKS